ncbi:hypothetical protein GQ600_25989 [Phytophthora cactorum]|nr:hypothetical protein GQ600_25989 [Phytophthora cactorum]
MRPPGVKGRLRTSDHVIEARAFILSAFQDYYDGGAETAEASGQCEDQPAGHGQVVQEIRGWQGEAEYLRDPQYKQWAASVTKAYKKSTDTADAAMISTLLAHYGDEPLTKMLAVQENPRRLTINYGRTDEEWEADGRSSDDVYKVLKLDDEGAIF